jgi:hypothetical protein
MLSHGPVNCDRPQLAAVVDEGAGPYIIADFEGGSCQYILDLLGSLGEPRDQVRG